MGQSLTIALLAALTAVDHLGLGRPLPDEWITSVWNSIGSWPVFVLLIFVLPAVAPISEEILMRGFLFRGLQYSKVGAVGAVLISSLVWAALHIQYDILDIFYVFLGGVVLGGARLKTGSLYRTIAVHSIRSAAVIIAALLVRQLPS